MARPKQNSSRVSTRACAQDGGQVPYTSHQLAPLRKRKPFVFWFVILGTLSMVVSVVYTLVLALQGV